jgi:hypothetical protein
MAGIVQDGRQRYVTANAKELEQHWQQRKAEIERAYAERLEHSPSWRRSVLRLLLRRELRRARLELYSAESLFSAAPTFGGSKPS